MKEIYTHLVERGKLLDKHLEELLHGRALPEPVIRACRFFSGGPHMLELERELREKFKEEDLLASGVFIYENERTRARTVMNPVLTSEANMVDGKQVQNIVIPYLTADGAAYLIRPHKLGLRGVPAEIYQEANLDGKAEEIVITEGEFKAAAGMAMGIQTVSIPGISSFSESNYPRLVDFLKSKGVKRVVIIFDNEVKDDPAFEKFGRYKPNPADRYDTQFYAYYMADRLEKSGYEVRIGTMPDSWRVDGKIDIDGALKAGRGRGDFLRIMYEALPRNEYLKDLSKEAKEVVLRKRAQKRNRGNIKKEFNRYVAYRTRGKSSWEEPISNFVMRIVATHDTVEGIKREVEFVNEFGRHSGSFTIAADAMGSPDKFRAFCLSKGDYSWKGSLDDLMTIWESEFLMMDEGRYIVEADQVGWLESEKLWLFGNVVVDREGKEIRPDKNGVFWLDKRGVKVSALSVTTGKSVISEGVPYLNLMTAVDMQEVLGKLSDTIGREEASVALGWVTAVPFMEEVFEYCGSFPFLFVTGQLQSGKSTIAEWIMRFFGLEQSGKSMSQTTAVGVQRMLAYYSSLPVFLDEYRNTKDIVVKNGFLRNVYNRQSAGKGIKAEFGLREARVRGTLVVAGEETPKDGALLTRFIPIFVSRQKRAQNHFNWFNREKGKFSSHLYGILKDRRRLGQVYAATFKEWQDAFVGQGIEDRLALNYATVVAGYVVAYGEKDLDFAAWLLRETKSLQDEHAEERAISIFIDDLLAMKSRKMLQGSELWTVVQGRAYIYFHALHQLWAEQFRKTRGEEAFKEGSIRAYLREEPGFLGINVLKKVGSSARRCVVFDLDRCSPDIRVLVDVWSETEKGGDLYIEESNKA